jgi:oligoribonuclease NrnB/cAMP/cGMP phosphodiesterase (DHH superfamily)
MRKSEQYDYVIYHKNCFDGFSGFIILTTTGKISNNAMVYPDVPSAKSIPPNIKNKNIIIIDVAYKKEVITEIAKHAKKITFIDHHISIRDDILSLHNDRIEIIYDQYKSGSSLTWEYFYKNKKMPLYISYIEDNDIGAWKLKNTIPFITGLEVMYSLEPSPKNVRQWKKLFKNSEVNELVEKGKIYSEYKNHLIDTFYKRYSMASFPSEQIFREFPNFFEKIGQYKVAVLNNTCPQISLLGVKVLEKINCDFVIMWTYNLDRQDYVLAFRSRSDKDGVDVSAIAKLFGGGGHLGASACSFSANKYNIHDLFGEKALPRATL